MARVSIRNSLISLVKSLGAERRCLGCSAAFSVPGAGVRTQGPVLAEDGKLEALARLFCPRCAPRLGMRVRGFCPACGELAAWAEQPAALCGICLRTPPAWDGMTFWGPHRDLLRDLLLRLKFRQELSLAHALGSLLAAHPGLPDNGIDLVVPIPLHSSRLLQRGFNQSLELARPLAGRLDVPLGFTLLRRFRATPPQRGLARGKRRENVRQAFTAGAEARGKSILLVDDIMTTGATMQAGAEALLEAGAVRVHAAVVSRTPAEA